MVVQHREWMTSLAVAHGKVSLEVHLPKFIWFFAFESKERLGLSRCLFVNAFVSFENTIHGAGCGQIFVTEVLQSAMDLTRTPTRMFLSYLENGFHNFAVRFVG